MKTTWNLKWIYVSVYTYCFHQGWTCHIWCFLLSSGAQTLIPGEGAPFTPCMLSFLPPIPRVLLVLFVKLNATTVRQEKKVLRDVLIPILLFIRCFETSLFLFHPWCSSKLLHFFCFVFHSVWNFVIRVSSLSSLVFLFFSLILSSSFPSFKPLHCYNYWSSGHIF